MKNTNLIEVTTTDDRKITVNISNEKCSSYGFEHDQIVSHNGLTVRMEGVGPNVNGDDVLYYEVLNNTKMAGKVCCFERLGNLRQWGFVNKQ